MLIDGGNGNGQAGSGTLGRYAGELPLIVERMAESFAAVTGIDLKRLSSNKLGTSVEANGNGRTLIGPEASAAPLPAAQPSATTS